MNPCLDNQTSLYLYVVYAREKINVRKLFYSKGTDVVFLVEKGGSNSTNPAVQSAISTRLSLSVQCSL